MVELKKQTIRCKRVIDGTGSEPKENMIIVLNGEEIVEINPDNRNASVDLNLGDLSVLPGLIDGHDHLGLDMGDEVAQSKEPLVYTAIRGVANARKILMAGVTTLRDVGEMGYLDVSWKRAIQEGLIVGPDLLISGLFITRTGGHGWFFGNEVDGADNVRRSVREQIKMGVDLIKIMITGGMSTPGSNSLAQDYTDEEIIAAVEEAHRAGRKITAHVHGGEAARVSIEAGIDSIDHGTYLTEQQLQMMSERGTWLVATVGFIDALMNDPESPEYYREKARASMDACMRLMQNAKRIGVKVAYGADTYHGEPARDLRLFVEAGYSNMEAIQIATRNGAELCELQASVGTLEVGKKANLIAVEGNPLKNIETIRNVRFVMKRGTVYKNVKNSI